MTTMVVAEVHIDICPPRASILSLRLPEEPMFAHYIEI